MVDSLPVLHNYRGAAGAFQIHPAEEPGQKQAVLISLLVLFLISIFLPFHSAAGSIVPAVSLAGTAIWLLKYDMARLSLKKPGHSFYSRPAAYNRLCLAPHYFTVAGGAYFGSFYDASLHSFFLGFVFMMIFAHAPVILPAVLKLNVSPFGRSLYFWYALLNITLLFRILTFIPQTAPYKMWAGMLNGIAVLGFFVNMAFLAAIQEKLQQRSQGCNSN